MSQVAVSLACHAVGLGGLRFYHSIHRDSNGVTSTIFSIDSIQLFMFWNPNLFSWRRLLRAISQIPSEMIVKDIHDEEKWLAEGIAAIQHNAYFMHRALVVLVIAIVHNKLILNLLFFFHELSRIFRMITISEIHSNTRRWCFLNFELLGSHLINIMNCVKFFAYSFTTFCSIFWLGLIQLLFICILCFYFYFFILLLKIWEPLMSYGGWRFSLKTKVDTEFQ